MYAGHQKGKSTSFSEYPEFINQPLLLNAGEPQFFGFG